VNKNTKIWVNYLAGGCISLLLLWSIYMQVIKQIAGVSPHTWTQTGPCFYLWLCIGLMFANTSLEGCKWYLLARSVEPVTYSRAFSSYLAGVAFSIITPNRVGEYPGRILYLGRSHTFRYINVSVLGVMAQLMAVYIFGILGLAYYNMAYPGLAGHIALGVCVIANILLAIIYLRFETWLPALEKIKWLRRFAVYGRLLTRVTIRWQIIVLGISILRVAIFTAQYLFLLKWMNVNLPLAEGYCMAALFFWIMAIIPSIAFTGLVSRMKVSLVLFLHFSSNAQGILAATMGIWLLNLVVPAIIGSFLILRMRLVR
jgi:hypothetical protein